MKKLRNATRHLPNIEWWRESNLFLNLDRLSIYGKAYVKFRIEPWTISITDSEIPQPTGRLKRRIIESLLDIYDHWEHQLAELGEPYYLKIWLYDPDFRESQVVCAIGEKINHYERVFNKVDEPKLFHPEHYGSLQKRLKGYRWEAHIDDIELTSDIVGTRDDYDTITRYEQMQGWFRRKTKRAYKTYTLDDGRDVHLIKRGLIWVGSR
ncbi:hypothetical protein [Fibrella aquatilis]|uniref:Uncharacterized protein n=1 Tax=Fibrella aquatilis TaxID=2817059 RepID=A0A939G573_9BACT|nr:hypothetical protein [Fibrella aquatilis]MBO0932592.1 hypothetical protein [Fibrella aquatilis]